MLDWERREGGIVTVGGGYGSATVMGNRNNRIRIKAYFVIVNKPIPNPHQRNKEKIDLAAHAARKREINGLGMGRKKGGGDIIL